MQFSKKHNSSLQSAVEQVQTEQKLHQVQHMSKLQSHFTTGCCQGFHFHCKCTSASNIDIGPTDCQQSAHREKVWVDAWVKQTLDFHPGDRCSYPVDGDLF